MKCMLMFHRSLPPGVSGNNGQARRGVCDGEPGGCHHSHAQPCQRRRHLAEVLQRLIPSFSNFFH